MMNPANYQEYKKLLSHFIDICNKNKLWYSLANETLLTAKTQIDYIQNTGLLEVFVTNETFTFLELNYKNNIVDFTSCDNFYLSTPFFYLKNNSQFIKIIIIVPTNVIKVKKMMNLRNKIKYNYSNLLTFKSSNNLKNKIMFFCLKMLSPFLVPIDHKQIFDALYVEEFRGFFAINSLNEISQKNWFPNLTFRFQEIVLFDLKVKIINENEKFLAARYGDQWKNGIQMKYVNFDYEKLNNKINK